MRCKNTKCFRLKLKLVYPHTVLYIINPFLKRWLSEEGMESIHAQTNRSASNAFYWRLLTIEFNF